MPSPVPGLNPYPRPAEEVGAAVQPTPQPSTATGCVACIAFEGVYAPLDVAYIYDGVSLCAQHLKGVLTADPAISLRGLVRPA